MVDQLVQTGSRMPVSIRKPSASPNLSYNSRLLVRYRSVTSRLAGGVTLQLIEGDRKKVLAKVMMDVNR